MNCPICVGTALVMTDRQGIEIDYCPQCRGVWLDRGELDKIIDKSAGTSSGTLSGKPSRQETERDSRDYERRSDSRDEHYDSHRGDHYKKKKREGFLSDLFDFD